MLLCQEGRRMRIVQKYGGTSLGDEGKIRLAARRMTGLARQGAQVVAVVSAQGQLTDELIEKAEDPEDYYINVIMQEKIRLYLEYVENASFWYDIKLIFKTFKVIISE